MASNSKSITDLWEGATKDGTTYKKPRYGKGIRYRAWYRNAAGKEIAKHFTRKREAQFWLDSITTSVHTGTYIPPGLGAITVGMWARTWADAQAFNKASTRSRTEGILSTHVLPRWTDVSLVDVTHSDVQTWIANLIERGLQPATVRKVQGVLSRCLSVAVKDGRLVRNPCLGVSLPRVTRQKRRYLTHEQVANLAASAGTPRDAGRAPHVERAAQEQYQLVVLVLAYCGLRWGELAALRVASIDFLRRRIEIAESVVEVDGRLVWGTPKTHERRSVPLPRFLADQLAVHVSGKQRDDLLFAGLRGGGVLRNRVFRRAALDRAAASIGMEGLVPQELRNTAASLAVSAGANVKAVQRMLGHASAAMTLDTYADLFDDDLDAVGDGLDRAATAARETVADQLRTRTMLIKV